LLVAGRSLVVMVEDVVFLFLFVLLKLLTDRVSCFNYSLYDYYFLKIFYNVTYFRTYIQAYTFGYNFHHYDGICVGQAPKWVRGNEWAELVSPRIKRLPILGLGSSVGTGGEVLEGRIVVVRSFDELHRLPNDTVCSGSSSSSSKVK